MTAPDHQSYAGIVSRLSGLAIDAALLTLAASLVVTGVPSVWATLEGSTPGWLNATTGLIAALLPVVYFAACWWLTGQTVGSLLLGTMVRRPNGRHLGPGRALLRAAVGLAFPPVWLLGMLGVLTDDRRRAWHDRLFGTVVRYVPRRRPLR
ncbi:RDD family protein [Catellatospora tritici]|uniref:RDD family protein n=1 Tax=Catellatospora tritici TaxID=2851566 RepID=UPI0027DEE956|nr:RDD family protein [Catellatospora tritici]